MSEAFVDAIINNALSTANSATSEASSAANEAMTASMGYGFANPPSATYTIEAVEPAVPEVENSTLTYEAQRDQLIQMLSDQLAGFFMNYYPLASDAFDEATNWLVNTITMGGTGIAPAVEAQIWQRGRDRVIADGLRVEAQTLDDFAARGLSMPSGAMAARLSAVRFEQYAKLQEQSRDVAIKQAEIEIETIKFAIEQAIKSRLAAMAAAVDYIRAIMSAPEAAAKVASINSDAKARMLSATADLYRARLTRDELAMKLPLAVMDKNLRAQVSNLDGFYRGVAARTEAAGHAASVYGSMAGAALSSLTSIAGSTVTAFSS